MAYQAAFPNSIPFSSLSQIISDIRGGTFDAATVREILWIAGCATTFVGGDTPRFGAAEAEDIPVTLDGVLSAMENFCHPNDTLVVGRWTPNPENMKLLLQLLLQLLPLILR